MKDHDDPTRLDPADDHAFAGLLTRLPREIPPERDLWPEIAARTVGHALASMVPIRPAPRRWSGRAVLALAASLAAVLVAGWLVLRALPSKGPGAPGPAPGGFVTPAAYRETDAALSAVRDQLRREVEARGANLPPELRRLVDENLATIDRAIREIEGALAAEPTNGDLVRAWVGYRQREISLLRQVNQAAAQL